MTNSKHISKAFATGYQFEQNYPGVINQTLPNTGALSDTLVALKAGATQHSLDREFDRLKGFQQLRNNRSDDREIER